MCVGCCRTGNESRSSRWPLALAGWECAGHAAVRRAESLGVAGSLGTVGKADDCGVGTRFGVGGGRHRVSQTRRGFGGRGSTVFRDTGQDRQLPGSGESAPCGRAGEYGSGLAIVSAGVLDERPGEAPGGWGSGRSCLQEKVGTGTGSARSSTRLGLAGPDCAWRCGIRRGHGVSRRVGRARPTLRGGHCTANRSLGQSAQDQSAGI